MPRSHRSLAQTGWFRFGTTPPARPFLEFDGLAGTPPNLGREFQTPNCRFCAGSTEAAFVNIGGRKMRRKFKGSFFAQTIVLLLLTWISASAWAHVTINTGDILVADTGCASHQCFAGGPRGQAVYRVNPVTGEVTTVSSGVYLDSPYAIDVEANGNIVVADSTSNVSPLTQGGIIRINPVTGNQTVVSQGRQDFACPFGIAIEANGNVLTSVFTFDGYGCSPAAVFRANPALDQSSVVSPHSIGWQAPFGMAVDVDGSILVADESYKAIFRVNSDTGTPTLVSQFGFLIGPTDVAIARATAIPDLSVTNTDAVTAVTAGDGVTYTYTITVSNSGTVAATGVTLTDSWPSAFSHGPITASRGSCNSTGGNFSCSIGTLAAGESATVTVNYTVPSTAPAGTQTNTANVTSTTPDRDTSNNSASDTDTVTTKTALCRKKSDGVTT